MAIKVQKTENTGVVYADPTDPGMTVRFKQTSQGKSLSGLPITNHVTEIIVNDDNAITLSGTDTQDAISIRLRVSATALSKARVKSLLGILAQCDDWADEDVFSGFRPVTTPVIPS